MRTNGLIRKDKVELTTVNNKIWQWSQDPVTLETPFNRRSFGQREQNILDLNILYLIDYSLFLLKWSQTSSTDLEDKFTDNDRLGHIVHWSKFYRPTKKNFFNTFDG